MRHVSHRLHLENRARPRPCVQVPEKPKLFQWLIDIYLSDRWIVVHLFAPVICILSNLIPFTYRIKIVFEPTVHTDGVDRDIRPVCGESIQVEISQRNPIFLPAFLLLKNKD